MRTARSQRESVTARVGLWLGVSFGLCFITGLFSHFLQHPPHWLGFPSRPAGLYRITQGVHVVTGIAAIPLLLAKLWTVFPKLFVRPVIRDPLHVLERGSILVLSASAFFQLITGLFNIAQNYPWNFYWPTVHYAVSWVAVGSILVHIAVKLPVIRRALRPMREPEPDSRGLSRRGFLRTTWLAAGVSVLATAGATVPWLREVSVLSWRSTKGPQGVPVNRTANAAGIPVISSQWTLEVVGGDRRRSFTLAELNALPQSTVELPIACVEGWSQSAVWTGVSLPELLRANGLPPGATVGVVSMEQGGLYARSTLPGTHTADPWTLLALRLNGEVLAPDHGYPCRIIAPNRPGVLQTKWVSRLEVR